MLRDITIGQFFPGDSPVHRMDSRLKLILNLAFLVIIFIADNYLALGISAAFVLSLYIISGISLKFIFRSLKPIMPLIIITSVLNLFLLTGEGEPIFKLGFITIYWQAIDTTAFMILRLFVLIAGMSLLTYTTSPIVLTDAIERLLSPLKYIRFPVHELAMMMTIAMRFIPTLIEETDKIVLAQKARGANFDEGSLITRIKAFIPIIVPLFVSAFKRANELALAMECRCYHGGDGRTKLRQPKLAIVDLFAFLVFLLFTIIIILTNIYF